MAGVKSLSIKQQRFCEHFLANGNATEAYKFAYDCSPDAKDNTIRRKGYELLEKDYISAHLDFLRQETSRVACIKASDLIEELEEARQLAITNNQSGAAIAATMGKAKILGHDKPKDSNSEENSEPESIEISFTVQDGSKKD